MTDKTDATNQDQVTIQVYSLVDFSLAVQDKILEGYRFDVTRNDTCPVQLGVLLHCVMVKPDATKQVVEQVAEVHEESAPVVRRGRAPKIAN